MKSHDIRQILQKTTDPNIVMCLCGIAESLSAQQQEIMQLAQAFDSLTDILMQLGSITEQTSSAVADLKKIRGI